jgi:hypothetical protein
MGKRPGMYTDYIGSYGDSSEGYLVTPHVVSRRDTPIFLYTNCRPALPAGLPPNPPLPPRRPLRGLQQNLQAPRPLTLPSLRAEHDGASRPSRPAPWCLLPLQPRGWPI